MPGEASDRTALVVGANQRSSSLAVRDRLYVEEAANARFLDDLRAANIDQALLLSTCDRVEVQAMHADPLAASRRIIDVLAAHGGFTADEIEGQIYVLTGEPALRHLFAVAASLESTVIGEPHVLGQMKESYRASRAAGLSGGSLEAVVQRAFVAAKRVRTETAIGTCPVSVCAAAVDLAQGVHGTLDRTSCLMIGTGEMGELLAEAMRDAGLARMFITDTRTSRAEAVARAMSCHVLPMEGLAEAAGHADIVIACLGSRTPVIGSELARTMLRQRRNRPIVFIDTGVPGDVDPLADRLDGVFLYTLDDLERVARDGRKTRQNEVDAARRIVEEEVAAFLRERAERAAVPSFGRLRRHFERVRTQALADAGGDAEKATRLLVNRLLHEPIHQLRKMATHDGNDPSELSRIEELLGRLFDPTDEDIERKQ